MTNNKNEEKVMTIDEALNYLITTKKLRDYYDENGWEPGEIDEEEIFNDAVSCDKVVSTIYEAYNIEDNDFIDEMLVMINPKKPDMSDYVDDDGNEDLSFFDYIPNFDDSYNSEDFDEVIYLDSADSEIDWYIELLEAAKDGKQDEIWQMYGRNIVRTLNPMNLEFIGYDVEELQN